MNNQYESTGSFIDEAYDFFEEIAKEPVIEPDIYLNKKDNGAEVKNIELSIRPPNSKLTIHWDDGYIINIDNDDLDKSIGELAGKIPGLSIRNPGEETSWNNQRILKGYDGNDVFDVSGQLQEVEKKSEWLDVGFIGTAGYDEYLGTSKNELVTYEQERKDNILGLFLTDTKESLTLVGENLSPR